MTPSTQLAVVSHEQQELQQEIESNGVVKVVDQNTHVMAGERMKKLVGLEKKVHEIFDKGCESTHKAWKDACELRSMFLDPVTRNKKIQVEDMKRWEWDQERVRQEAERKAQEEARKQAEEDALAQAEALEKEGRKEEAEAIVEAPIQAPQVIIQSNVTKGYGQFTKKTYSAQVTDLMALAKAVVAGKVPVMAIQGNDTFLNGQARMMKETFNYPGVKLIIK